MRRAQEADEHLPAFLRQLHRRDDCHFVLLQSRFFLQSRQCFLDGLQIRQDQLGVYSLEVGRRGYLSVDMHHIGIGEGPDDLTDRVRLPDVREELVTESLPLRRAANDTGDVDEAQTILVSTAKDLAAKGEIMITKNRADDELVY